MEELEMFLRNGNRSSENTKSTYRHAINMFFDYFGIQTIADVVKITKHDVMRYVDYLGERKTKTGNPISVNTICTYMAPIESFYNFLIKRDYVETNPAWRKILEIPSREKKLLDSLVRDVENGVDEVTPFLNACITYRQRAIVLIFLATGIRVGELCNLKIKDILGNTVSIREAKWNEVREVYVGDNVIESIQKYIKNERVNGEFLFTSRTGKQLSRTNINEELKAISRRCGLHKNITPHSLRRSCAGLMAVDGRDIGVIQNTLGHASMSMTTRYIGDIKGHRKSQSIETMNEVFGGCGEWEK